MNSKDLDSWPVHHTACCSDWFHAILLGACILNSAIKHLTKAMQCIVVYYVETMQDVWLSVQGWEEIVDVSVTHLLRTALSKSAKDVMVNPSPLALHQDTEKVKKHISVLCDRLSKGAQLSEGGSKGGQYRSLRSEVVRLVRGWRSEIVRLVQESEVVRLVQGQRSERGLCDCLFKVPLYYL